ITYFDDVEKVTAGGLGGADTFLVTPSPATAIHVVGGPPTTRPGDALIYNGDATLELTGIRAGTITGVGVQPVAYTSIEECVRVNGRTGLILGADADPNGNGANNGIPDVFRVALEGGDVMLSVNGSDVACLDAAGAGSITYRGSADGDIAVIDHGGGLVH